MNVRIYESGLAVGLLCLSSMAVGMHADQGDEEGRGPEKGQVFDAIKLPSKDGGKWAPL